MAIALPLVAVLLATHLAPALPQARVILLAALAEYAVGAVFGVITYLGSFAEGLFSVRATFDGLLSRAVWLAFLTIAVTAVYRVYRALYPRPPKINYSYGPTVYGRPYPGQPTYPRPTGYSPGPAYQPVPTEPPTAETAFAQPPAPPTQSMALPVQPLGDQAETTRPMPSVGGVPPLSS